MKEEFRRNYQNKRTPWLPRKPREQRRLSTGCGAQPSSRPSRRDPRTPQRRCRARPGPGAAIEGCSGHLGPLPKVGRGKGTLRSVAFCSPPTFTPNPERSGLGGRRWSSWEERRLLAGGSFPDLLKGGEKKGKKKTQCPYLRTSPICKEGGLPAACRLSSPSPLSFYEAASSRGAAKHPQVCALSGSRGEPAVPLGSFPIWQQL